MDVEKKWMWNLPILVVETTDKRLTHGHILILGTDITFTLNFEGVSSAFWNYVVCYFTRDQRISVDDVIRAKSVQKMNLFSFTIFEAQYCSVENKGNI